MLGFVWTSLRGTRCSARVLTAQTSAVDNRRGARRLAACELLMLLHMSFRSFPSEAHRIVQGDGFKAAFLPVRPTAVLRFMYPASGPAPVPSMPTSTLQGLQPREAERARPRWVNSLLGNMRLHVPKVTPRFIFVFVSRNASAMEGTQQQREARESDHDLTCTRPHDRRAHKTE